MLGLGKMWSQPPYKVTAWGAGFAVEVEVPPTMVADLMVSSLGYLEAKYGFAALVHGTLFARAGGVWVLVIEHFNDVDALVVDGGEGSEALGVEEGVVFEADEDFRGAGIGLRSFGEGEGAANIFLGDGIVFNGGFGPGGVDGRVGVDAELRDEIGDDAVEAGAVVVMMLDEIVEAVGAVGGPVAVDGDGEFAASGVEFDLVRGECGVFQERGLEEGVVVSGSGGFGGGGGFRFCGCGGGCLERREERRRLEAWLRMRRTW